MLRASVVGSEALRPDGAAVFVVVIVPDAKALLQFADKGGEVIHACVQPGAQLHGLRPVLLED